MGGHVSRNPFALKSALGNPVWSTNNKVIWSKDEKFSILLPHLGKQSGRAHPAVSDWGVSSWYSKDSVLLNKRQKNYSPEVMKWWSCKHLLALYTWWIRIHKGVFCTLSFQSMDAIVLGLPSIPSLLISKWGMVTSPSGHRGDRVVDTWPKAGFSLCLFCAFLVLLGKFCHSSLMTRLGASWGHVPWPGCYLHSERMKPKPRGAKT